METVYDTKTKTVTANGNTDFDLATGLEYIIGADGDFDSGNLTLFFIDDGGNSVPVPIPTSHDGAASPLVISDAVIFTLPALTSVLRFTAAAVASASDITVTVTRLK